MPDQRLHFIRTLATPRRCLLATLFLFTAMVAIGAIPGKANALSAVVYDKILHVAAYAGLAGLIYSGINASRPICALNSLLAIATLGAVDEAIQSMLPYRHANFQDWKYNMLGASVCVGSLFCWQLLQTATADADHDADYRP